MTIVLTRVFISAVHGAATPASRSFPAGWTIISQKAGSMTGTSPNPTNAHDLQNMDAGDPDTCGRRCHTCIHCLLRKPSKLPTRLSWPVPSTARQRRRPYTPVCPASFAGSAGQASYIKILHLNVRASEILIKQKKEHMRALFCCYDLYINLNYYNLAFSAALTNSLNSGCG